jgi:iron complex outermembrane receptor protein
VTGRSLQALPSLAGFGSEPLARSPFGATVVGNGQWLDAGTTRLSDITRLDASLGDAYNSEGYWSFLSVRGFVLDNRFNYRRDGLPINAETAIGLANKERIAVLKGTSGIQAGTSAPGGLVDFIVKRPDRNLRAAGLEWRENGTLRSTLDLSQRFGTDDAFGLRVNAAYGHLDPQTRSLKGRERQFAVAGDWRPSADTLIEAEFEHTQQSQPSVPGFSMLGSRVPDAGTIDARINLNNQPWSQPVVLQGDTASLRLQQRLGADWRFTAHGMVQRLKSDDRLAYAYGCSAEGNYDRYCSDGTFDLYDFRSDNERRRSDALDLAFTGQWALGGMQHHIATGVLFTRFESRFQDQAYNYVGTGNIEGTLLTPADPALTDQNTNRDERSTELYLRDRIELGSAWSLWAGLRHTRLHRDSVRTDGSRVTGYAQTATLPWVAVSRQWTPQTMVYASWGQGLESDVAPNRSRYTNAGEALPSLKSKQVELGIKHEQERFDAALIAFAIERPQAEDIGTCDDDNTCTRRIDGSARHRGVEGQAGWRDGPWQLRGSAMWLHARRQGASNPDIEGKRPTNVPRLSLRLQAAYEFAAVPGLAANAGMVYEGDRIVLPDNSARIPGWTRFDLGARYVQRTPGVQFTWRVGVDNVADKRAWRESPYQFSHVYLYPLAPRTFRASVQAEL